MKVAHDRSSPSFKDDLIMILPLPDLACLRDLVPVFTEPTARRFLVLLAAAILPRGRHTIANLLRTVGTLAPGHRTSYQRVLSAAQWSSLQLACAFTRFLVRRWLPTGPILLVGDDTVEGHPGPHVDGKARHRDPVRSTPTDTAWKYGHRGVVLAVLVRFPGTARPWALPVLVDLYRSPELDRQRRRPHRTPPQRMRCLLRVLLGWFPERSWVFVGDGNDGTHELARFGHRHRDHLAMISKFHPMANLVEPPPRYAGLGRPRVKGEPLPKPAQAVEQTAKRTRLEVAWYGGGRRKVETLSRAGQWYKSGRGLVPVRWVDVRDKTGTHRDEFFFATRTTWSVRTIIEAYTARWNVETTFQECRAHLGMKTTQGWAEKTVLRATPCLFGLYGLVALLDQEAPPRTAAAAPTGRAKSTAPSPTRCPPSAPGWGPNGFSHRRFPTRLSRNFRPPGSGSCSMHSHGPDRGAGKVHQSS
jgi:hypothetical protein